MSGVVINIKAGATVEESSVSVTGELVNIITNSERASFGIATDDDLKRLVGKYFGKEPNDVFLHSPTPWGDMYKMYGWPQVQRVLQAKSAQILGISTQPTILATKTFNNDSDVAVSFDAYISEQVTNSVSTEWSNSSKISVEQSFTYNVGFLGSGGGGSTKFGFEQTWGRSETVSKQTTVGTETGVTVPLKPGQSVVVDLSASSGTMRIRITYEAYLIGWTAINYNSGYHGHHYWALPIGGVLGDLNNVQVVEDIQVGFYSNVTATVRDGKTNENLKFYMAAHPDEAPTEI